MYHKSYQDLHLAYSKILENLGGGGILIKSDLLIFFTINHILLVSIRIASTNAYK